MVDLLCAPGGGSLNIFGTGLVNPTTGESIEGVGYASGLGFASALVIANSKFLYSLGGLTGNQIDPKSLALTQFVVPSLHAAGSEMALTPSNQYLYISENNVLEGFRVDATTGALTAINGSPFSGSPQPTYLSTDSSGKYLYVSDLSGIGFLYGYSIASDGSLTAIPGSPFPANASSSSAAGPQQIGAVSHAIYVALAGGGGIAGFTVNPGNGVLTPIAAPYPAGSEPWFLTTAKNFVFATDVKSHYVYEFKADVAGELTSISAGSMPPYGYEIQADPQGSVLYVAGFGIDSFLIDPTTGVTTFVTKVATGAGPAPLAVANVSD